MICKNVNGKKVTLHRDNRDVIELPENGIVYNVDVSKMTISHEVSYLSKNVKWAIIPTIIAGSVTAMGLYISPVLSVAIAMVLLFLFIKVTLEYTPISEVLYHKKEENIATIIGRDSSIAAFNSLGQGNDSDVMKAIKIHSTSYDLGFLDVTSDARELLKSYSTSSQNKILLESSITPMIEPPKVNIDNIANELLDDYNVSKEMMKDDLEMLKANNEVMMELKSGNMGALKE